MNILRLNCEDRAGIVAAVATVLSNTQCNIEESSQYNDPLSDQFYMRVVFNPTQPESLENLKNAFEKIADEFSMDWQICDDTKAVKTAIMVSQHDHCLHDLIYRWRTHLLPIEITAIISNHENAKEMADYHELPFHYLPITKETKKQQEEKVHQIVEETGTELIVLARYMQILSEDLCNKYPQRIINIHHSFLPGFKGAKPYHQAYERGVKIIGATAHFVTTDLDEGPIITQDIERIDHSHTPTKMKHLGQDIESRVLARAVDLYTQRRIFMKNKRTIIL